MLGLIKAGQTKLSGFGEGKRRRHRIVNDRAAALAGFDRKAIAAVVVYEKASFETASQGLMSHFAYHVQFVVKQISKAYIIQERSFLK